MQISDPDSGSRGDRRVNRDNTWYLLLIVGVVIVALFALLLPRSKAPAGDPAATDESTPGAAGDHTASRKTSRGPASRRHWELHDGRTAAEVVTNKVARFANNRREVMHRIAKQFNVEVPARFEQFFDAAEAGQWDDMKGMFDSLRTNRQNWAEGTSRLWPTVMETFGVAEVARDWPAQQLLDYGQAVLGPLRPDMVYVGGTDPGRFIPTLLNETSEGEHRIVITQNALADNTYLEYVQFLYADRLNALNGEDSKKSFEDYIVDAQKRLLHDQQFPNEPRQVRPGEDIQTVDGRVQISGQVAVMAINENLFRTLMDKNPGLSFAIEQSFPLKSLYPDTTPLGPIMELRSRDPENALTAQRATETTDYWRATTQQLLTELAANDSSDVRLTYGKMAAEQAALLLDHNFPVQAEENFRFALQLSPSSPEVVFKYVSMLANQGRAAEAVPVVENAMRAAPDNAQFRGLFENLQQNIKH